jgi:hypothetical protein
VVILYYLVFSHDTLTQFRVSLAVCLHSYIPTGFFKYKNPNSGWCIISLCSCPISGYPHFCWVKVPFLPVEASLFAGESSPRLESYGLCGSGFQFNVQAGLIVVQGSDGDQRFQCTSFQPLGAMGEGGCP